MQYQNHTWLDEASNTYLQQPALSVQIYRSIDLVVGVLIWIDYTTYPRTLYATTVGGGGTTAEAASQNITEHISRR